MHDPTPANVSLGGSATATVPAAAAGGFVARYGAVFVWHAISAVLAWCVLAPCAFAWLRVLRRAGNTDVNVRHYRGVLFAVVVLTVQAWLVAVTKEHSTPPAHAFLGSCVLLIIVVHTVWYSMQSSIPREVFEEGTKILSIAGIGVAGYTCHHSINVFDIATLPAVAIHTSMALSICAILFALLAPVSACKRLSGIRPGYFEQGNDHHNQMSGLNLNINIAKSLTTHLGFRVVEDDGNNADNQGRNEEDEELLEEQALSLVTTGDEHTHIPTTASPNTQQRADT